ncbi:MAG: UDP-3-O-(3-hydroxymyristoyl)glucosamine N-acyltransferase [bacterium]|nr:UDP-3-O-(3-hydroxymyristoyl)glucosamine N-acyltransferase [bacterium]
MLLGEIADLIDGSLIGDPEVRISDISSILDECSGKLTFILEKKYIKYVSESKAVAFVTFKELSSVENQIIVKNPRKALAQVIAAVKKDSISSESDNKLSNKAEIHDTAIIDPLVSIKSFCTIGEKTVVKKGTRIMSNVSIGSNCVIGSDCFIHPHVTIYNDVKIGNNVILHAGCVIGSDGFGYYPENNKWNKIPHTGKVIIEDDVEIGANTCLDRGCLGNTEVGKGTKIDNLTHVAHNTVIGQDCIITGLVAFMGGAKLGNNIQIGGQAGIADIEIGNNVVIAAKSGVTKNIPDNKMISGFPAREHVKELKKESVLRKIVDNYSSKVKNNG